MARADANGSNCSEAHFKQGTCKIILKQGDLMREDDVDVIVIPTPEQGHQDGHQTYPLFEKILSNAADKHLKDQIKRSSSKMRSVNEPQFIETKKPSYILTITPFYQSPKTALKLLGDTYNACLNLAMHSRCQTIAFPTIGCGNSGFQIQDAAGTLFKALIQFRRPQDKQFKEIRIVIFKKDIFDEFINIFIDMAKDKTSTIKFIEISSTESCSNSMLSKPEQHRQDRDTGEYSDDFEDADGNSRGRGTAHKPGLNPNIPAFRPQGKDEDRNVHRYFINNKRTELHIVKGDILQTKVDAIVNAANESMLGGSGVDGVIHKAAGEELYQACKRHKQIYRDVRLPTGRSRILLSYDLSRTTYYIINTAGPRYDDHSPKECEQHLTSCYKTSLALANLYDLKTIAYTAISCGIFGYPPNEGAQVALSTVDKNAKDMKTIYFVLKDEELYRIWIEVAERLQFDSMDETGSRAATISRQPSAHAPKASQWDDPDRDRQTSKQETAHPPQGSRSDDPDKDRQTSKQETAHSSKASKSGDAADERHGSSEKVEKKEFDASRKNDSESTTDPARGRSIVAKSTPKEEVEDVVDDDAVQTGEQGQKSSASGKKQEEKDASKQSSSKKPTPKEDSKGSAAAGSKGASSSASPASLGRGKKK